jgi:hypothetical protein
MSEGSDKLARSRQAIIEHIARKQRKHDPRETTAGGREEFADGGPGLGYNDFDDEPLPAGGGWFAHLSHAVRVWWRYHPAHMAVELVTPLMRSYARRKPVQLLGIAFGAGAALTLARPWKLISIGTLAVALLKSSQLTHLLAAAMSAADYPKDSDRPE